MSVVESEEHSARPTPVTIGGTRGGPALGTDLRKDRWWIQPALIVFGLTGFAVYSTWAAFRNGHYWAGTLPGSDFRNYLSPFYSPCLTDGCATGPFIHAIGFRFAATPALLILVFPLGFRVTCYYYRKSYYRSFWLSPPACAVADFGSEVGGKRPRYKGESRFPLIMQNVHRYFWYFAVLFASLLTWDAIQAFRFHNGFGMGLGTLIFIVNAALIWMYTLGCHSCRHLCGGSTNTLSKAKARHWFWANVASKLNAHHQFFAWTSLIWIAMTDLYVFLIASNAFHDPRFF